MSRLNTVASLLEDGNTVVGCLVANGDDALLRDIATSEYDFVIIEMEHSGFDLPTLEQSLQMLLDRRRIADTGLAAAPVPLVRIPTGGGEQSRWIVKQALDAGVYGIVAPHVTSADDARSLVAGMRYPAAGLRGWARSRAHRYWGIGPSDYVERADLWPLRPRGELLLVVIVEDAAGLAALPEILAVPGVGAVWAGGGDLSVSLGHPLDRGHPKVEAAIQSILQACVEHDIPCCIDAGPGDIERRVKEGFRLVLSQPRRSLDGLERARAAASRSGCAG
jgi:4-hydroxy-2-oxoheptanedioate aldolase